MKNQNVLLAKAAWNFAKSHANIILSTLSVIGLVATSIEASKATLKASEIRNNLKEAKHDDISLEETVKACWKEYIPTAVMGGVTITCIVASGVIAGNDQKKLAAAYAMLDQGYKAYRKKISEKYGEEVDREIANEASELVVIKNTDEDSNEEENVLFYDIYNDRYFDCTMLKVQQAIYVLNRSLQIYGYASVNDLYRALMIPETEEGNYIGWNIDEIVSWLGYCWLDFDIRETLLEDGLKCFVLEAIYAPNEAYID